MLRSSFRRGNEGFSYRAFASDNLKKKKKRNDVHSFRDLVSSLGVNFSFHIDRIYRTKQAKKFFDCLWISGEWSVNTWFFIGITFLL